MSYVPQRGRGKDGAVIEQGDAVRTPDGMVGTAESFFGGSHTFVSVRSASGHTYTYETVDVEPAKKS